MRYLEDILAQVEVKSVQGSIDEIQVSDIQFDSRQVTSSSVFVAVKGSSVDGHQFIDQVIDKGVKAIVVSELPKELLDNICYIEVKDTSYTIGLMASEFYDNPSA